MHQYINLYPFPYHYGTYHNNILFEIYFFRNRYYDTKLNTSVSTCTEELCMQGFVPYLASIIYLNSEELKLSEQDINE